jgi:DHA2 family multidrug resistance protein
MDKLAILRNASSNVCLRLVWGTARYQKRVLNELDWPGLAYAGIGFSLLYMGLDQGNRLDWTNNGLVNGFLVSGTLVTTVFIVRELWVTRTPFLNLRLLSRHNLVLLMLLFSGYRFVILSTS